MLKMVKKNTNVSLLSLLMICILFSACSYVKNDDSSYSHITDILAFTDTEIKVVIDEKIHTINVEEKTPSDTTEIYDKPIFNPKLEVISDSGKKKAIKDDCNSVICFLYFTNTLPEEEADKTKILVDGGLDFVEMYWSENDEWLAYEVATEGDFTFLKIFNTLSHKPGIVQINEGYQHVTSDSISISDMLFEKTSLPPAMLRGTLLFWSDKNLILKTEKSSYPEASELTFWSFDPNLETLEILGSITLTDKDQAFIKNGLISNDLKRITYIKDFGMTPIKQELWVANADGSEAELIYKNY